MAPNVKLIGKQHIGLVEWFSDAWWQPGESPVAVLQGFPGAGKTEIADQVMQRLASAKPGVKVIRGQCPQSKLTIMSDLVLLIAGGLALKGDDRLARTLTEDALLAILAEPVLIVIDEFQESFDQDAPRPANALMNWIERICTNKMLRGRVLFLTSRQLDEERWNERCEKRRLDGLSVEDGLVFLAAQLEASMVSDPDVALPQERREDVVKWLGGYPRALRLLVSSLHLTPLNVLIGVLPEAWQAREQPVSPQLLQVIEREIVSRARKDLPPEIDRFFERLAVFRRPVDDHAMAAVSEGVPEYPIWKQELQRRFLLELRNQHYSLHPVLRETVLMCVDSQARKRYHALAGRHYGRHFTGKKIEGTDARLGAAFIEARYHYTQSGNRADLAVIAHAFEGYVKDRMGWTTPVPGNADECSEIIALLSALLDGGGATSLHYYLARLLERRNQPNDMKRALEHAKKGTGPLSHYHAWLLRTELIARCNGPLQAWNDLRAHGLKVLPPEQNLFALYQRGSELLVALKRRPEAIALLREGMARIDQAYSLDSLYTKAAALLVEDDKLDDAIELLEEGISRVAPESSRILYIDAVDLLDRRQRVPDAITLSLKGAALIGAHKSNRGVIVKALQYSFAARDESALHELQQLLATLPNHEFLSKLAKVYRLLLQGADKAMERVLQIETQIPDDTRKRYPYYIAYCFLCLGQPARAQAVVDRYHPDAMTELPNNIFWLASYIQLELHNQTEANRLLERYLNRPLQEGESADRSRLMGIWDDPGRGPSADFPVLFPVMTGLSHMVHRTRWQAAVLAGVHIPRGPQAAIPSEWDARHVILCSRSKTWDGIYVVGCFDRRITVFTQQARALSLIRALFEVGDLAAGQHVAVVGAGAAGVTAAVAAARLGCTVTLYDEQDLPLMMQADAGHRYLHPHIYDWPATGSDQQEAGLPLLNWHAGTASEVSGQLRAEFSRHQSELGSSLTFKPQSMITRIKPGTGPHRVQLIGNDAMINKSFDLVLLATGFGVERSSIPEAPVASYWGGDGLNGPFPSHQIQRILVSGAGDGGLVDVARAAIRSSAGSSHFRHHEAVENLILDSAFYTLARRMAGVDDEARRVQLLGKEHESLYRSYDELLVPESLLERMRALKRSDTDVTFNYTGDSIFSLSAALLNRLLVFLLMKARIVKGKLGSISSVSVSPAAPARKQVVFDKDIATAQDFDIVVLRHGPPVQEFERRFPELATDCGELRGTVAELALTQRLSPDTVAWYTGKLKPRSK